METIINKKPKLETYQQLPDAVRNDIGLKPQDHNVYMALISHKGQNDHVWPSAKTLAKELNISTSTVNRSIRSLVIQGHIERRSGGYGKSALTYFKTYVKDGVVTKGTPLPDLCQPKRRAVKKVIIDDIYNEERELYYINQRAKDLADTNTEYSWDDCKP